MCKSLYIKYQVWLGKTIDISYGNDYPANALSNLSNNAFVLDNILCASMESLLQSLTVSDTKRQKEICSMDSSHAVLAGSDVWLTTHELYWMGNKMQRNSAEYQTFLKRAYTALFIQNDNFQTALLSTKKKKLYCLRGINDTSKALVTSDEMCEILTDIRSHSHELLNNLLHNQDTFIHNAAKELVDKALRYLDNQKKDGKSVGAPIASIPSDPMFFQNKYTFYLVVSSPIRENNGKTNERGLREIEACTSNMTTEKRTSLGYIADKDMNEFFNNKAIVEKIYHSLVANYDKLDKL